MCEVTVTLQLINHPFISENPPKAGSGYIIGVLKVQSFESKVGGGRRRKSNRKSRKQRRKSRRQRRR